METLKAADDARQDFMNAASAVLVLSPTLHTSALTIAFCNTCLLAVCVILVTKNGIYLMCIFVLVLTLL